MTVRILTDSVYVHHDEIGEELRRPFFPLHDRYESGGNVLLGLDPDNGLEFFAEGPVVGFEVLQELLVDLNGQDVDRLESALYPQGWRVFERALFAHHRVPFFCQVARRHVVYGDVY